MAPRKARGFTLVELLVVIGIIAVLVAILLPALHRARPGAGDQLPLQPAAAHDGHAGQIPPNVCLYLDRAYYCQ